MTENTDLDQRFARLNAQRDLHRPLVLGDPGTPTVPPMRESVAKPVSQNDSLVPRSAVEQKAFEARQAAKADEPVGGLTVGKACLTALKYIGLVFREIGVMFAEGASKRHKTDLHQNGSERSFHDTMTSPAYSHHASNRYYRSND